MDRHIKKIRIHAVLVPYAMFVVMNTLTILCCSKPDMSYGMIISFTIMSFCVLDYFIWMKNRGV